MFTSLQEAVKSGKAFGDRLYLPRVTQQKLASHHPPSLEQRKNEATLEKNGFRKSSRFVSSSSGLKDQNSLLPEYTIKYGTEIV